MKKAIIAVFFMVLVSLIPKVTTQALSPADLSVGLEETEEARTQREINNILGALKESIDAENGECWTRTIEPLKMERYDAITKEFEEISNHFNWKMEVEVIDDENFQISLENNNYLIKKGDTLSKIAKKYHTSVSELLMLNQHIVNANCIYYDTYLKIDN